MEKSGLGAGTAHLICESMPEVDLAIVADCGSILCKIVRASQKHRVFMAISNLRGNICILKFIRPSHIKLMLVLYSKQYKSKYGRYC